MTLHRTRRAKIVATLGPGQAFRLALDPAPGNARRANLPHPEIFAALAESTELLRDDGKSRLGVQRCDARSADTRAAVGGRLSDRKGANVPNVVLPISALTSKDRRDLDTALSLDVDWIALSFVQRPEDVHEARSLIGGRAGIITKLEKPTAIELLDEILAAANAVMLAAESAAGRHPVAAVAMMDRIIAGTESGPLYRQRQLVEAAHSPAVAGQAEAAQASCGPPPSSATPARATPACAPRGNARTRPS